MKTITTLIFIIIISIFVLWNAIDIIRQDREIEELREQIGQEQMKTFLLKTDLSEAQIRLDENKKYNLFQQALNEIDKNDYSADYNCYEFTKDLQQELIKLDIYSVIAITKNREHAYLFVGLEATEGRFMEVDNGYEIMEIRDSNLEVIAQ